MRPLGSNQARQGFQPKVRLDPPGDQDCSTGQRLGHRRTTSEFLPKPRVMSEEQKWQLQRGRLNVSLLG